MGRRALLFAFIAFAGPATAEPVSRLIAVEQAGRVVVALDRDVYDHARVDLGDLRVVDEAGAEVPYLLDRLEEESPQAPRRPTLVQKATQPGQSASAVLDFGSNFLKRDLTLDLPGDQFLRRVRVEARGRFSTQWTLLTDAGWVAADPSGRHQTIVLPENNERLLRVTVFRGAGDTGPLRVEDAWSTPELRRQRRGDALTPRWSASVDPARGETDLTLDLGARAQPFVGVVLQVGSPEFFRGVTVEERQPDGTWAPFAGGSIYRERADGRTHEQLAIDAAGRAGELRVRIADTGRAPLTVTGVTVLVPAERLAFEAQAGHTYHLEYGRPEMVAPQYELARRAGDPALWAAPARATRLLPP